MGLSLLHGSPNATLFITTLCPAEPLSTPRTAMALMRHAEILLTTAIYQHLELADTARAVNRLPVTPSTAKPEEV